MFTYDVICDVYASVATTNVCLTNVCAFYDCLLTQTIVNSAGVRDPVDYHLSFSSALDNINLLFSNVYCTVCKVSLKKTHR